MSISTHTLRSLLLSASLLMVAHPALAFNPNEGAEDVLPPHATNYRPAPRPTNQPYAWQPSTRNLSPSVAPARYYAKPAIAAAASAAPAPFVPAAVPAAPVAPAPAITFQPAAAANVSAPVAPSPARVVFDPAAPYGGAYANSAAPAPYTPVAANAPRIIPVENAAPVQNITPIPAEGYVSAPPPVAYQPETLAAAPAATAPRVASSGGSRTRYSLGVEGFYDNYQEPETFPDLENEAYYGAITGKIERAFGDPAANHWFGAAELRASYGQEDYSSSSGNVDGIDQYEFEGRILGGYAMQLGGARTLKLYSGLGDRYYRDQFGGEVTDLGALGYDRRINQIYVPIGATLEFPAFGYTFIPNLEFDKLVFGYVESQLQEIPGFSEGNNLQHDGYGIRGEFLVRKDVGRGQAYEFGPFFRYWNVDDSKLDTDGTPPFTQTVFEPKNKRYQIGAKFKYLF